MAPRPAVRVWKPGARGAGLIAGLWLAGAASAEITGARYVEPTDIYGHGALSNGEFAGLEISHGDRRTTLRFEGFIFEDTAPRLADMDGDGSPEVVAVMSDLEQGARIAIFGLQDFGRYNVVPRATTAPIGTRHRWLAIAGIADLDGDGWMEIAYVDRPHLARFLRVVEVRTDERDWRIVEEAAAPGFTNHKLGDPAIEGGIFDCGDGPVIVTADADWRRVMVTRLSGNALISEDVGPYTGPESLICP